MKKAKGVGKAEKSKILTVKRNINMLEYPMWVPSRKLSMQNSLALDHYKVWMTSLNTLPSAKDIDILDHLLAMVQMKNGNILTFDSQYSLMKEMGLPFNSKEYARVQDSLRKWEDVTIEYDEDVFYAAELKKKLCDKLVLKVLSKVTIGQPTIIEFDKTFLDMNDRKYSMNIKIPVIKNIENPYAKRLFEILYKSFRGSGYWIISKEKLAAKMPMHYSRPKVMEGIIEKSIAHINKTFNRYHSFWRYVISEKDGNFEFGRYDPDEMDALHGGYLFDDEGILVDDNGTIDDEDTSIDDE